MGKLQEYITLGRLKPLPDRMLTMRDLLNSGIITKVEDGVKLLAKVSTDFVVKIVNNNIYDDTL